MALIKKMNTGGSTSGLNTALDIEIAKYKLSPDVEAQVRSEVGRIRDYLAGGEDRSLKMDDVTNQWTITGPESEQFQGSFDKIRQGFLTGRTKPKGSEQITNIAATLAAKQKPSTPKEKPKVSLTQSFKDAVLNYYGGENNMGKAISEAKDDAGRQNLILSIGKKVAQDYIDKAGQFGEEADYGDLEKAQSILQAQNWDEFLPKAYETKWDVSEFLLRPEEREVIEKQEEDKIKEATAKNFVSELTSRGMSPQVAGALSEKGFNIGQFDDSMPSSFKDYLQERKAILLQNAGRFYAVDTLGNPIQETGENFDPFHRYHGLGFINTDTGLQFTSPKYDLGKLQGRRVLVDDIGENKAYLWDSMEKVEIKNPNLATIAEYKRQPDGTYKNEAGETLGKIKGLGNTQIKNVTYDLNQLFPGIKAKMSDLDPKEAVNILKSAKKFGSDEQRAFETLKYLLQNNIKDLDINFKEEVKDTLADFYQKAYPQKLKNGGVLFAKKGAFAEYSGKFGEKEKEKEGEVTPLKDIRGTWKDLSTGQKVGAGASTGFTAMSLVPGWTGAIGATGAFITDIARNKEGNIKGWEHALNFAFIPLSFFGLGGLKAVTKGTKAAKSVAGAVGKTDDIVKLGTKALKNVAKTDDAKKAISAVDELAKSKNITNLADLKKVATTDELKLGVDLLEKAAASTSKVLGSATLGAVKGKSGDVVLSAFEKSKKLAMPVLRGTMAATAIPSAVNLVKTSKEEGFEYTKPEDLKKVVMGVTPMINWARLKRIQGAIGRQAVTTGGKEAVNEVKLGDKSFTLKNRIEAPKTNWKGKILEREKAKEKALNEWRKKVEDSIEGTLNAKQKAELAKLTPDSKNIVQTLAVDPVATEFIGDAPKWTGENPSLDARDYEIARKYLQVAPKEAAKETLKVVKKQSEQVVADAKQAVGAPKKGFKNKPKVDKKTGQTAIQFNKKGGILYAQGGSSVQPKTGLFEKVGTSDFFRGAMSPTTIGNIGLYASTLGANREAAKFQKRAAIAGITKLSGISPMNISNAPLVTPQAQKMAGEITSKVGRIAKSTSDLDKGTATQLEGIRQVVDTLNRGQEIDRQSIAQQTAQQMAENKRVQEQNLRIGDQNAANVARAEQQVNLIDVNKAIANNAALNTFVQALHKNVPVENYRYWLGETERRRSEVTPQLKEFERQYKEISSEQGLQKYREQYEARKRELGGYDTPFEESEYYKAWEKARKKIADGATQLMSPVTEAYNKATQSQYKIFKKGGSLSVEERSRLQKENAEYKQQLKELEMFYKSILKNNEMLQKALIKVFK